MPDQSRTNQTPDVFPTIITWPQEFGPNQIIDLLASTGVIDPASARMLIARTPPFILGRYQTNQAAVLVNAVRNAGGDAFAPRLSDLATLGPTLKIKEMQLADGNLNVDIWRGLSTTIRREHIQFLVRGQIGNNENADRANRIADRVSDIVHNATRLPQYGYGVRASANRSIKRYREDATPSGGAVSEKLDIHLHNGTVFQIDGDKFAFTILGNMKGFSDKTNMDQLCDLLIHISPDEVVDTYFSTFRPPPGHHQLFQLVPELRRNNEDPVFAFYSRWSALLYRHVMGLSKT